MTLGYLFLWPLLIFKSYIPASDSLNPNAGLIRMAIYIAIVLCDFIIYWFVIYMLISWWARRFRMPSVK
jgi:hypothetical protein